MAFFSKLFKTKPEQPRTREEMENSLSVQYKENYTVKMTNGTLTRAFNKTRPPKEDEKKLLKETFDLIASVPQGKKLLDEVAKGGYEFYFETARGHLNGSMTGATKKIMLCPANFSHASCLATTAFHEMTHALQNEQTNQLLANSYQLNAADQFKFRRAAEAAAWTEEAKFAYQLKEAHPEVEPHVKKFPMYNAFAEEMEKSGDISKAGEAAFKSWYGFKHYQTSYEEAHLSGLTYTVPKMHSEGNRKILSRSISSEEILDRVFLSDDVKKNIQPDFLTSKEAFSISPKTAQKADLIAQRYTSGKHKDLSIRNMYSYETGKKFAEPQNKETLDSRAQPSIMSSLTKINKDAQAQQAVKSKMTNLTAQH